MDEMTFQHELRELKQRVTDIANTSQTLPDAAELPSSPSVTAIQNDLFVAHLRDVKMRINAMEDGLNERWRRAQNQTVLSPEDGNRSSKAPARTASDLVPHTCKFHRIYHRRFDHLERVVSELRGIVHRSILTPDASETTVEDVQLAKEGFPADTGDVLENAETPNHVSERDSHPNTPATLSQALQALQQDSAIQSIHFTQQEDDATGNPVGLSELLAAANSESCHDIIPPGQQDENEKAASPVSITGPGSFGKAVSENSSPACGKGVQIRKDEILREYAQLIPSFFEAAEAKNNAAIEKRDEQIRDLEKAVQDRDAWMVKHSEDLNVAHQRNQALWQSNQELEHANQAKSQTIHRLSDELKEREASRHHFMTKYVDENYRFKWLEQRKLQSEQYLQQQLSDYERALKYSERYNEAQVKHALRSRDEELDKINSLCRDNEAIIYQQEEIIARGGLILEQRDDEIDQLHHELEENQREKRRLRDHTSKLKGILRDRDEEIRDLKYDVKDEKVRRNQLEELMRRDAETMRSKPKDVRFSNEETQTAEPFARAAEAVTAGRGRPLKSSWSPQPIREGRVLPREEERRRLWEDGDTALAHPRFGSASPIAKRKDEANQQSAVNSVADQGDDPLTPRPNDRHKRRQNAQGPDAGQQRMQADRIDETHHRSRRSSDVNSKGMKAQARANDGLTENHRHALPLDVTRWPPLPARTAGVEKVGSVPNLRAGSQSAEGHSVISKPASMLDLRPGRKSQTYHAPSVETEAESAEEKERSGSSLLD